MRRLLPWLPLVVATAALARAAVGGVLLRLGHPGAALDDAYIHFHYARAIVEGHPLRYHAGEPISSGATSFAWPLVLAPFYAFGFRGEAILWPAWTLSFVALGALAREVYLLASPLAGRAAAAGAAAMALGFGGLVWCAASGMEVVPFAWLIAFATRRAAEWAEAPEARTRRDLAWMCALAAAAPLARPEGAVTSLVLGATVALFPAEGKPRARAAGLACLVGAVLPNLLLLALTGHATSTTAQVKLLFGNPYHPFVATTLGNAKLLVTSILDGGPWSAEFVPKGAAPVAVAGLFALAWRGRATGRWVRAGAVLALALTMFVPCTYVTFLWNRLRYLWPFAPGWFVGAACLAHGAGAALARARLRGAAVAPALVTGALAGALAARLDWVLEDVAQSASGIDRQQVALGRWAAENLPPDARLGVNDTGAIAYFGGHRTFDVVGLTTPGEGRYWVAGAASRLEHYERLRAERPGALPTHFIVYPEWMACEPVLGTALHEAVVRDATILGGAVMRVHEARWDELGSGEAPWTPLSEVSDALDVADLESEGAHHYALLGARDGEQIAERGVAPDGRVVVDGGRTNRAADRFVARLPAGRAARGVARVEASAPLALVVRAAGREVARAPVDVGPWTEISFDVPAEAALAETPIEVTAEGGTFTSFHYWFGPLP